MIDTFAAEVFAALLRAMIMLTAWFAGALAIAAGLLIVILLIIAIYSWMRGDKDSE